MKVMPYNYRINCLLPFQICKKFGMGIARGGVKERFEEKNFVRVNGRRDGSPIDPDDLLAVGIEGGAEDMNEIGEGKDKVFEFTCAPGTQFVLTKSLQQTEYSISDIGRKWVPFSTVEVSEEQAEKVGQFCDAFEEHPEATSIYTNLA